VEQVEFGNGLRSHIAHEAPVAEPTGPPFGPVEKPAPAVEPPRFPSAGEWVRDLLRTRAGEQAERIWAVFDEALRATDAHGRPDHALRLRAAEALLAEVYGPPTGIPQVPDSADELATHRRARLRGRP
jgi:hypothetical protein